MPMHGPPAPAVKCGLFTLYHDYHLLPAMAPYAGRADFNAALHVNVVDHTDFAFLRAHPDKLRVVGAPIDAISLTEARVRSNAFRQTLGAKAEALDAAAPLFLNPLGMLADNRDPATVALSGIGSSALWIGAYVASQTFRWQVTHDPAALANVEHALDALLLCVDAPGEPGVFARAVKPADGDLSGGWNAGTGPMAGVIWKPTGNNDMSKGLLYGFATAYDALPAGHPKREAIKARVLSLLAHSSVIRDGRMNEMMLSRLVAWITGDPTYQNRYRRLLLNPAYLFWIVAGNGAIFEQGITDWSGNHLNLRPLDTLPGNPSAV
ncbi:MAG: hypothetical protein HYZ53_07005 [Planctomycetes bacterium]|nr:hypothetical protein [Planctomycetota bacterium]